MAENDSPTTGLVMPQVGGDQADIEDLDTDRVSIVEERTPQVDLGSLPEAIIGEQVGPYRLRRQIGEGGMGRVYLAEEIPSGRVVALKVLKFRDHETLQRRFDREGDVLERLQHPNIVALLARGTDPELRLSYLAFEHVPGRDLGAILKSLPGQRLSSPEVVYVLDRCARALGAAHALGVLHRDIKLANVLVTPDAQVRLIDFGIALANDVSVRLSARDEIMGTLNYIAPDVLQGSGWGPPADIYALGCLGFRMLIGRTPFKGRTPVEIIQAHRQGVPNLAVLRPETPPGLSSLLNRMLSPLADARPTAEEVSFMLQRLGLASETQHVAREWSAGRLGLAFAAPGPAQPLQTSPDQTEVIARAPLLSASSEEVMAGRTIGPYRMVRPLGRGAMGEVYLVQHPELGTHYALKLLAEALVEDEEALARFQQEMANLAAVDAHPGIVRVHSSGTTASGRPYFAMEYVEGQTLGKLLRRGLGPVRGLDILEQVTEALAFAHEHDLVHRDVKPENVLVDDSGRARLTDFGLAKALSGRQQGLTRSGDTIGTPVYMSPEQGRSQHDRVGPWSDVFSLGAMLFEVFVGKPPYYAETSIEVYAKLIDGAPIPSLRKSGAEIGPELEAVILKALALTPEKRYPDARALLEDLRAARAADQERPQSRALLYLGLGAAGALVLAFLAILFAKNDPSAPDPAATVVASGPTGANVAAVQAAWAAGDVDRARTLLAKVTGPLPLRPAILAAAGAPAEALAACGEDVPGSTRAMLAAWAGDAKGFEAALQGLSPDQQLALRWSWADSFSPPLDAPDAFAETPTTSWRLLAQSEQALAAGAPSLAEHLLAEAKRAPGDATASRALTWSRLRLELARGRAVRAEAAWNTLKEQADTELERLRVQAWGLLVRRVAGKVPSAAGAGKAARLPLAQHVLGSSDPLARRAARAACLQLASRRAESALHLAEAGGTRAGGSLAATAWEAALKLGPSVAGWVGLARARLITHEISAAAEAVTKALALGPQDPAALLVAARVAAAKLEASPVALEVERSRARNKPRPDGDKELAQQWANVARAFERAHKAHPSSETRLWLARSLTQRLDHLRAAGSLKAVPVGQARVVSLTEPLVRGIDAIVRARKALSQAAVTHDDDVLAAAERALAAAVGDRPRLPLLRALYLRAISGAPESRAAVSAYLAVAGDLPARALLSLRRAEASKDLRSRLSTLRHAVALTPRAAPLLLAVELAKLDQESVETFARDPASVRRLAAAIASGPEWTAAVLAAVRASLPPPRERTKLLGKLTEPADALARGLLRVADGREALLRRALLDLAEAERHRPTVAGELLRALALAGRDRAALEQALGAARAGAPHAAVVDLVTLHTDSRCDVPAVVDRLLAAGFLKNHGDLLVPPGAADATSASPDVRASIGEAIGPITGVLNKFKTETSYSVGVLELLEKQRLHPQLRLSLRLFAMARRARRARGTGALRAALERADPGLRDAVELMYRYYAGRLEDSGSAERRRAEGEAALAGAIALRTSAPAGGWLLPAAIDVQLVGLGPDLERTPGLPAGFRRSIPKQARLGVYRQLRTRSAWVRYALARALGYAHPRDEDAEPLLLSAEDLLEPWGRGRAVLLGVQNGSIGEQTMEWLIEEVALGEAPLALDRAAVFRRTTSFSDSYENRLEDYQRRVWRLEHNEARGQDRVIEAAARAGLRWTRDMRRRGKLREILAEALLGRAADVTTEAERVALATAALSEAKAAAKLRDNKKDPWVRLRLARAAGVKGDAKACAGYVAGLATSAGSETRELAEDVRDDPLLPILERIPAYRAFVKSLPNQDDEDDE